MSEENVFSLLGRIGDQFTQAAKLQNASILFQASQAQRKRNLSTRALVQSSGAGSQSWQMVASFDSEHANGGPLTVDVWQTRSPTRTDGSSPAANGLAGYARLLLVRFDVTSAGGNYSEVVQLPAAGLRRKYSASQVKVSAVFRNTVTDPNTQVYLAADCSEGYTQSHFVVQSGYDPGNLAAAIVPRFTSRWGYGIWDGATLAFGFGGSDGQGNIANAAVIGESATLVSGTLYPWPADFDLVTIGAVSLGGYPSLIFEVP